MSSSSYSFIKFQLIFLGVAVALLTFSCEEPDFDDQPTYRTTLQVTSVNHVSVDLSWTMPEVVNFKEYQILRGTVPQFRTSPLTTYDVIDDIEDTSTFITDLLPNTQYYFRVRVMTTDNRPFESNEVSATTAPPPAVAQIRFIHASPSLSSLRITIDPFSSDTVSFGDSTLYRTYPVGRHLARIFNEVSVLDSGRVTFDTATKATVFILDKPPSSQRFVVFNEREIYDTNATVPYAYFLRFINASPGLDTASLYSTRIRGFTIGSKILFGKASLYSPLGTDSLTFFLTKYQETTALIPPVVFHFSKDKRYSIVAMGKVDSVSLRVYVED